MSIKGTSALPARPSGVKSVGSEILRAVIFNETPLKPEQSCLKEKINASSFSVGTLKKIRTQRFEPHVLTSFLVAYMPKA